MGESDDPKGESPRSIAHLLPFDRPGTPPGSPTGQPPDGLLLIRQPDQRPADAQTLPSSELERGAHLSALIDHDPLARDAVFVDEQIGHDLVVRALQIR